MRRIHKIIAICALLLLVAVFALLGYAIRTFDLNLSALTTESRKIAGSVGAVSQGVMKGTVPWRKLDTSSIGFPEKEAKLVALESDVEHFSLTFGHAPSHISELSRLSEKTSLSAKDTASRRKGCEIINLEADSYILDCDNFSSIPEPERMELLKSFDKETERFYEVRGHILLYVPPPTLGKSPVP